MFGKYKSRYALSMVVVIFVVSALIGGLLAIDHQYFTRDDNASYFFPSYVYDWRSVIEQHTIPLINFYQYLGHPYLATGQSAVLYPPVYISAALSYLFTQSIDATINIAMAMHLLVGAVGMFFLLRQRKLPFALSALLSVAYISLPIITTLSRSWISVAYTAAYLPWVFLCLHRLMKRLNVLSAVVLALVHALFLLQGNIQFVLMGGFFELVFIGLELRKSTRSHRLKIALSFLFSFALTILLAAVLLFPMFTLFQVSLRDIAPNTWMNSLKIVFPLLVNMVYAQVFLGPTLWHIGIPFLAFFIVLQQKNTRPWVNTPAFRLYAWLALIAFLFSDLLAPLTHFLPVLGYFRWPWKYYVFFGFFFIPLLGDCVHAFLTHMPRYRRAIFAVVIAGIVLNSILNLPGNSKKLLTSTAVEQPPQAVMDAIDTHAGRVSPIWITEISREHYGQVYAFDFSTLYRTPGFSGYEPLVTQKAYTLTFFSAYSSIFEEEMTPERRNHLNAWSVRYFVTQDTSDVRMRIEALPDVHLLASEGGVLLYENTQARPFAYVEDAPTIALPTVFGVNDVTITTSATADEDVVLTLAPQKGYELFFDGVYIKDLDPNGEEPLRFAVPAGVDEVTVRYTSRAFTLGLLVSILSLSVCCVVLLALGARYFFTFYRRRQ